VYYDKVIVAVLGTWEELGIELRGGVQKAENAVDVSLAFFFGNVAPRVIVNEYSPAVVPPLGNNRELADSRSVSLPIVDKTYHSLRTFSLSLLHVVDFSIAASRAGRPLFSKSLTASAATRPANAAEAMALMRRIVFLFPFVSCRIQVTKLFVRGKRKLGED